MTTASITEHVTSGVQIDDDIPGNLIEFGEIPVGFVVAYTVVPREILTSISNEGLCTRYNQMGTNTELEAIFQEGGRERGVNIDRTKVIYAYPCHPDKLTDRLSFDPKKQILLEIVINPKTSLVADAAMYTEASVRLSWIKEKKYATEDAYKERLEEVRLYADQYWQDSLWLSDYQKRSRNQNLFSFPEVLIPANIPVDLIRVSPKQPKN